MAYSAVQIANWLLAHNAYQSREDEYTDPITHLKLQKLLYYAQGAHLAICGTPLFAEDIYAWEHGPVVKEVYEKYKGNKSAPLDMDPDFNYDSIQGESLGVLRAVYNVFGQYSAWKLREMTHSEDPWKNTPQNQVIEPTLIKAYFETHYVE